MNKVQSIQLPLINQNLFKFMLTIINWRNKKWDLLLGSFNRLIEKKTKKSTRNAKLILELNIPDADTLSNLFLNHH